MKRPRHQPGALWSLWSDAKFCEVDRVLWCLVECSRLSKQRRGAWSPFAGNSLLGASIPLQDFSSKAGPRMHWRRAFHSALASLSLVYGGLPSGCLNFWAVRLRVAGV